ncbi:MAG: CoA-binding protein [Deltaproteobacteria bacterium]|nr:MAG: CoA-binding protein [Deltaproteobacteria bacterium]
MEERLKNLDYLFRPRSVAFVGATETIGKWGCIIFNNLVSGGYEGKVYPVNPGRESVFDFKCYPSVRDIPDEVDLAVFTVPARQVVEVIDDCVAKGVKAGLVISAGFKELGGEYVALEAELVAKARRGGMLVVGPNSQGVCCTSNGLYPWMPFFFPPSGKVGVVSQSGNIQSLLIGSMLSAGLGISKAVSSGNEADLKMEDYLAYFAQDSAIDVIASYVEGVTDGRWFMERIRAVTKEKPVVILQGGRTQSGMAAAASHTGAIAVSSRLFDAACKQAGAIQARTVEEAGIVAVSFINRPLPRGRRVGIVTGGGGLGVIASDVCTNEGLDVVKLSDNTLSKIGEMMPEWWVPGNPVDLVAGLRFETIVPIIEILMKSGEVDSLMFIFSGPPQFEGAHSPRSDRGIDLSKMWDALLKGFSSYVEAIHDLMHELKVPFYQVTNHNFNENLQDIDKHTASYLSINSACRAVSAMARYYEYCEGE